MSVASNVALAAAANAVVDRVDLGSGTTEGKLVLLDGAVTVATVDLANPAFGAATEASPSVATAASLPLSFTASADGTVDGYEVVDRDGTVVWSGSAGDAGTEECVLDNASVSNGQNGSVTAFTWTQPNGT
jgi:hypothetical protein